MLFFLFKNECIMKNVNEFEYVVYMKTRCYELIYM